jgi:predicted acetyltransferase
LNIEITPAKITEKAILRRLLEFYQYDFSEFDGADVDEHGCFDYAYLDHYWTEPERHPFLIRVDGKIAGFALIRALDPEGHTHVMAELFVMRKYRRQGIGRAVACRLFDRFPGQWRVGQEDANRLAQAFWRAVIADYTRGEFEEVREPTWAGPIQRFSSRR